MKHYPTSIVAFYASFRPCDESYSIEFINNRLADYIGWRKRAIPVLINNYALKLIQYLQHVRWCYRLASSSTLMNRDLQRSFREKFNSPFFRLSAKDCRLRLLKCIIQSSGRKQKEFIIKFDQSNPQATVHK